MLLVCPVERPFVVFVLEVEGATFVRGREHGDEYAKCVWCRVVFVWLDE